MCMLQICHATICMHDLLCMNDLLCMHHIPCMHDFHAWSVVHAWSMVHAWYVVHAWSVMHAWTMGHAWHALHVIFVVHAWHDLHAWSSFHFEPNEIQVIVGYCIPLRKSISLIKTLWIYSGCKYSFLELWTCLVDVEWIYNQDACCLHHGNKILSIWQSLKLWLHLSSCIRSWCAMHAWCACMISFEIWIQWNPSHCWLLHPIEEVHPPHQDFVDL